MAGQEQDEVEIEFDRQYSSITRVGKPVRYRTLVNDEPVSHAALIVKVWTPECVNLVCFDESGHSYTVYSASHSDDDEQDGTWDWA